MCSENYFFPKKNKIRNSNPFSNACIDINFINIISMFFLFTSLMRFITLFAVKVNAETNVSCDIYENTTWILTGSPYIVTGSVTVTDH